jgi:glycerol-3-phosphate acyltransferase PlsY
MNKILLFSLASYVVGSISGSLLLGKLWNIDIRNFGSKSAGGTNALRTVGFVFALLTFIIDLSKGLIPTYLIACYSNYNEIEMMIGGFATIIGHVYPIFYRFNGGKGAATLVGTLIILNPLSLVYVLSIWIIILILSGFVGLSTILSALALFIYSLIKSNINFQIFSFLAFLFILFTHRSNIQRMVQKSENRFTNIMIFRRK